MSVKEWFRGNKEEIIGLGVALIAFKVMITIS